MCLNCIKSSAAPEQDACSAHVEVDDVAVFETDFRAKMLAHNTLPSWEKEFIEMRFQLLCHLHIRDRLFRRLGQSRLNEVNCFDLQIFMYVKGMN